MDLRDSTEWLVRYYNQFDSAVLVLADNSVRISETLQLVIPLITAALPAPDATTWTTYLQGLDDYLNSMGPDPGAVPSLASLTNLDTDGSNPARPAYPETPYIFP